MKLTDEIVIADIEDCKKVLIVNLKTINVDKVVAKDLSGQEYTLIMDLAGFNGRTKKTYFDYYLDDKYLPPIYTNQELMADFKLDKDSDVSSYTLFQIECKLNESIEESTK
jgi:hypothetical protein